jgi:hypothetical protein
MPIPITDYSDSTAGSELTKAGIAGVWLGLSTEAGGRLMGAGFKRLGNRVKNTAVGVANNAGPMAKGMYGGANFLGRGFRRAGQMYGGGTLSGGVNTAAKVGSWLYRNPVKTGALAGGLGIAAATLDPNERTSNEVSVSPSVVESMGGTSTAGARQLMEMMNASGNIVLGSHNRR